MWLSFYHKDSGIIKYMSRQISTIVLLFVIGTILFASFRIFEVKKPDPSYDQLLPLPSFSLPSLRILPTNDVTVLAEAWEVFENYLEFARTHNLTGIRSLSHQISSTCLDSSKEAECFALMDNVYSIGSLFVESDFKYVYYDNRQIVMFTDGPTVAILYLTIDGMGALKVLSMTFCYDTAEEKCAEADSIKRDLDGNGWWDSVEDLFY